MRSLFRPRTIRGKLLCASILALTVELFVQMLEQLIMLPQHRAVRPATSQAIWLFGDVAASVTGLAILVVFGNRIARPIRRICHAAYALSAGDFRKRLRIGTGDEWEDLGHAFNSLGESLLKHDAEVKIQAELLAGMVEAARLVSSSLDVKQCGKAIAKAVCGQFGATSSVVYRTNEVDGGIKSIGRSGTGQMSSWKRLASHTADSGEYLVVSEQRSLESDTEAFLVGIPLSAGGRSLGAIVARFNGATTRNDLRMGSPKADVLTAFGIQAASAITNAEAYSQTEKYSEILEDWVEHLSSVMQVTNAISPSLTLDETISALTKATASVLKADECAIYLLDRQGELIVRSCCSESSSISGSRVSPGQPITGLAYAEKRPIACFDLALLDNGAGRAFAEESKMHGALSAPLLVEDHAIGAITVYNHAPRQFTADETRLLTSIALHAAVVVRNADLFTREYSIAESLQKGLVSETPDACAGMKLASRYMPALDEASVGGDFYDVTQLRDGRVAVVIGDVSGKGLQAAIHLATCKYMIKALIYTYPDDPAQVLHELNAAINHYFDMSFFVTVFYGVIDPDLGTLTYVSAGHPPAVLICHSGKMHSCLSSTGMPVGAGQNCHYEARRVDVEPSDMLLMYTDGVTDVTRNGKLLGVEGLHDIVFKAGAHSPRELVEYVCDQIQGDQGSLLKDDIALMAVSFDGVKTGKKVAMGGFDEREQLATQTA